MKKFLQDLQKELQKKHMKSEEINDIISDHEEMIQNAIDEGLSEAQIIEKFGDPKNLADELADDSKMKNSEENDDECCKEEYKLWKSFEVTKDTFNVDISLTQEDVCFKPSKDKLINVYYLGKLAEDKYTLKFENDLLTFNGPKHVNLFFINLRSQQVKFMFEIPENMIADEFKFRSVNADCEFSGIKANNFIISTTNGDLEIKDVKFGDVKWNSVNGDINLTNADLKSLCSSQVSGDIECKRVKIAGPFRVHTVSGDMNLTDSCCDELDLHTVSGDVNGKEFYPKKVILKAISGDICITNKEKTIIEIIKKSSVSGDIKINN